jgi:hypothetical protein
MRSVPEEYKELASTLLFQGFQVVAFQGFQIGAPGLSASSRHPDASAKGEFAGISTGALEAQKLVLRPTDASAACAKMQQHRP